MKKRHTKISTTLITISILIVIVLPVISYLFYTNVSNINPIDRTKVKSIDLLSIDSIKQAAIQDTVISFSTKMKILESASIYKDTSIKRKSMELSKIKKDYDSLLNKIEYYKSKFQEEKSKNKPFLKQSTIDTFNK